MWFLTWVKRVFPIFFCCDDSLRFDGRKWLVVAGKVTSSNDSDIHFIGARELMNLYGVPPYECLVWSDEGMIHDIEGLILLEPRYDGNYNLTDAINRASENEIKKGK